MPVYEYLCTQCGKRHELLQKMSDPPAEECPDCNGKLEKQISAANFQFKGTGFYSTDYKKNG